MVSYICRKTNNPAHQVWLWLYAKADKSPYSGKIVPKKPLPALAEEALNKLGVKVVAIISS